MSTVQNPSAATEAATAPKLVLVSNELQFSVLLDADVETVDGLAKAYAKTGKDLAGFRDNFKEQTKAAGKVYCALEIRLNKGKEQRLFPMNKALTEFIKDITEVRPPTHALTLKNAFGAFVQGGFIAESDYDANSNNCLEIAARIVDVVKGDLAHPIIAAVAKLLKERPHSEAKDLRATLASLKPAKRWSNDEALEVAERLTVEGHLVPALAHMVDCVENLGEKEQRDILIAWAHQLVQLETMLGDKVQAWKQQAASMNAPVQILHAGVPAGAVAPETEPSAVAA